MTTRLPLFDTPPQRPARAERRDIRRREFLEQGQPTYNIGKITVPTFLIHAEWDADLPSYQAQEYFKALINTPYKRFVELSEGAHTVMLEKNRMQFFREIMGFLDEVEPTALRSVCVA